MRRVRRKQRRRQQPVHFKTARSRLHIRAPQRQFVHAIPRCAPTCAPQNPPSSPSESPAQPAAISSAPPAHRPPSPRTPALPSRADTGNGPPVSCRSETADWTTEETPPPRNPPGKTRVRFQRHNPATPAAASSAAATHSPSPTLPIPSGNLGVRIIRGQPPRPHRLRQVMPSHL